MNLEKQDAKTRIIRFLVKADITLSSEEEKALKRWEHIDHLLRQGIEYSDIILKVTLKFDVSRRTADNDIMITQEVFSRSRKLNKQYIIHLQHDMMDLDIRKYRKTLFEYQDKDTKEIIPIIPDPKDIAALAKMYDAKSRLISMLPDDNDVPDVPRPVTYYQLPQGEALQLPMAIEQALRIADHIIDGNAVEDIDHEELSNEADEPTGGQ